MHKDMAIIHGVSWSKDVIKRKDWDQSSAIIYDSWVIISRYVWGPRDAARPITAWKAPSRNKENLRRMAVAGRLQRTDPGLPNDPRQRGFFVVSL